MPINNILSISYAKRLFETDSRERQRIASYAAHFSAYHVIVFSLRSDGFTSEVHDESLHLYPTNSWTKIGALVSAYRIARRIRRANAAEPWHITTQDPFESAVIGRLVRNATCDHLQLQIHGDVFNSHSAHASLLQRGRVWCGKLLLRRADSVRVVSQRIKASVCQSGIDPQRVTVLPIQADIQKFFAAGVDRVYAPQEILTLLYVGRLSSEKNLPLVLQACALLLDKHCAFRLRLVGSGPLESALQAQVAKAGLDQYITFVPWSEHITQEMKQADVLCLSSNHEGWAMVLLEAAAAGLPAVTTKVGCVGELLVHDHSTLAVETGDATAFAAAIERLQDPVERARIGQAARATAQTYIDSQANYLKQILAIHGQII